MEQRLKRFMYDNELSWGARVMLAEISQYYGSPIDCRKDDVYFSIIFKVQVRQVRRWRAELKKLGYLEERYNKFGEKILQYVPNIEERDIVAKQSMNRIVYFTKDDLPISNTLDAITYFESVLTKDGEYFTASMKTNFRYFCQMLASTLFDEKFYNISLGRVRTSQYMFQFIVESFNLETIFTCVQKVALQLEKVRDPQYYILTSTINAFKDKFDKLQRQEIYQAMKKEYEKKVKTFLEKNALSENEDKEKIG